MVHVSFRVAAEKQSQYLGLLKSNRNRIESHVSNNILKRHIEPLFVGRFGNGLKE